MRQGRASDDVVLAVQRTSGGWYNTEQEGEAVLRFVVTDGRLELDASVALPESGPVLWLDEDRAVVSTKEGVAFLSHGPGSLSLDAALPLPLVASSATFVGEALWLAGEHGVVSVQLPCP